MTTFVILSLLAVVVWIVRSVMHPGIGGPDKKTNDRWAKRSMSPTGHAAEKLPVSVQDALRGASEAPPVTRKPAASTPMPRNTSASAPASRNPASPTAAQRDAAQREASQRPSARTTGASSAGGSTMNSARTSAGRSSNTREAPADWYVVLDVSRDAPRTEVLSAVKRRIERARIAGDTPAIAHILRAAENGLGSKGVRELARKLGTRS